MKLSKKIIFNLNEVLNEINTPSTFQFNYMVKRNKDKFLPVIKSLPMFKSPNSVEYDEYLKKTKEKIKKEEIKFKEIKEINAFYETEIHNYPKAEEQRKEAVEDHAKAVGKWENEEVEIDIYLLQDELCIPDGLNQEQFEIITEYFIKKNEY